MTALWYRHAPLVWGDDATFPFTSARASQYFHLLDQGLGGPDGRKFPFLLPIGLLFGAWHAMHLPYRLAVVQPLLIVGLLFASTNVDAHAAQADPAVDQRNRRGSAAGSSTRSTSTR